MVEKTRNFKGALFCDRDGVLVEAILRENRPYAIESLDQIKYCVGVENALKLVRNRIQMFMVTNQPEIARGTISYEQTKLINTSISNHLGLTAVFMCPHDDFDDCLCRKPKPGLLDQAAAQFNIDLRQSFMVGDRWKDVSCAQASGLEAFFIDNDYEERKPEHPYQAVNNMEEVVNIVLEKLSQYD
jgi:D-glycero-D-manno-heptose 1,7-bisphosphate phosphatase